MYIFTSCMVSFTIIIIITKFGGNLILYFFSSHIITKYKANNDAIVKYLDNFKLSELLSRTTPINSSFLIVVLSISFQESNNPPFDEETFASAFTIKDCASIS